MYDIVDDFYVSTAGSLAAKLYQAGAADRHQVGQFFLAPSLYLIDNYPMDILRGKYNPATGKDEYRLDKADAKAFEGTAEPLQSIGLRERERAAIVRCKLRPVVIVSVPADTWTDKYHRHDDCYVVAPIYTFRGDNGKLEYTEQFIERVKAYEYNSFFYVPERTDIPRQAEAFVRFDRIQVIDKKWLQDKKLCLGPDAKRCLETWLALYVANEMSFIDCSVETSILCISRMAQYILDYRKERLENMGVTS